jgi:hypothetical protein
MGFEKAPQETTSDITAMTPKKVTAEIAAQIIAFLALLMKDMSIIFHEPLYHESLLPHLLQKALPLPTVAPQRLHVGNDSPDIPGLDRTEKYRCIIRPFMPIIDAVLMIKSAMMMDGGLWVTMEIS